MPTKPNKSFLNRDLVLEEPGLSEVLERFCRALDEVVNYGTHIFGWCIESLEGTSDKHAPLLLLFRHMLELADAVSILIKHSAPEPCKAQLRAMFEAQLSALYLLEKDHEKRAFAFMVCRTHRKIAFYKNLDQSTVRGKDFKGKMKKTPLKDMKIPDSYNLNETIESLNELLTKPGYKEANDEFKRLKKLKNNKSSPSWYQLYNGKKNLEELAILFDKRAQYEIFYRSWSEYMHSTDVISGNVLPLGSQTGITALRSPEEAQLITSTTLTFLFELYIKIVPYFIPEKLVHYNLWQTGPIWKEYVAISKSKRIIDFDR